MQFNEAVQARMNQLGMRGVDLARCTGYSQQYISDLLSGRKRWNETTMTKISQALGIKIEFKVDDQAASQDIA
jgi:transcriptional regulator with XRE-family HTH domain